MSSLLDMHEWDVICHILTTWNTDSPIQKHWNASSEVVALVSDIFFSENEHICLQVTHAIIFGKYARDIDKHSTLFFFLYL